MLENEVYEGVEETLKEIRNRGKKMILAVSQNQWYYCEKILQHFKLDKYFDFIGGSNLDETRCKKVEVITYSLENIGEVITSTFLQRVSSKLLPPIKSKYLSNLKC